MMTYGDLRLGKEIMNPETFETATITALGNGLVEITLPDGHERTVPPDVLTADWSVDGPQRDGYGAHACDAPRVGE